jgi:hypothetical protein
MELESLREATRKKRSRNHFYNLNCSSLNLMLLLLLGCGLAEGFFNVLSTTMTYAFLWFRYNNNDNNSGQRLSEGTHPINDGQSGRPVSGPGHGRFY